ncbi:SPT2-like [Sigmodon hispidus]
MNFTDLLRLAEKKQFEPVEMKPVRKAEEWPMTAEELREQEFLERKHRKKIPETEVKLPPPVSKRAPSHKDIMGTKPSKRSGDRQLSSKGLPFPHTEKKSRPSTANEKEVALSSSKSTPGERTKAGSGSSSQSSLREGHNRPVFKGAGKPHPSTCSPSVPKTSASGTQKSTEHKTKNLFLLIPAIPSLGPQFYHTTKLTVQASDSQAATPAQFLDNLVQGQLSPQLVLVLYPSARMAAPAQDLNNPSVGTESWPATPIPRDEQSMAQMALDDLQAALLALSEPSVAPVVLGDLLAQGPQRLPFPTGYKRPREYEDDDDDDDEYDSEMDDFIKDEGEPQEEISKHIREIVGSDQKKYKDESGYALGYMESSWKEQQEETKSLRLGMQKNLEEMRHEEEDIKRGEAEAKLAAAEFVNSGTLLWGFPAFRLNMSLSV